MPVPRHRPSSARWGSGLPGRSRTPARRTGHPRCAPGSHSTPPRADTRSRPAGSSAPVAVVRPRRGSRLPPSPPRADPAIRRRAPPGPPIVPSPNPPASAPPAAAVSSRGHRRPGSRPARWRNPVATRGGRPRSARGRHRRNTTAASRPRHAAADSRARPAERGRAAPAAGHNRAPTIGAGSAGTLIGMQVRALRGQLLGLGLRRRHRTGVRVAAPSEEPAGVGVQAGIDQRRVGTQAE